MKWPARRDIMDRAGARVYLTRWWLLGSNESRYALMLHKMHRPDDDSCHHDHPWSFFTLVLWGGYVEEVTVPGGVKVRNNRPGMLLWRRAEHTHRIASLPRGVCYTLLLRMKKRRKWGFHTPQGWIGWRQFIDLRGAVAWCEELLPKRKRAR